MTTAQAYIFGVMTILTPSLLTVALLLLNDDE